MRFTNRLCQWAWKRHALDFHLKSAICSIFSLNKIGVINSKNSFNINHKSTPSLKRQQSEIEILSQLVKYWRNLNISTNTKTVTLDAQKNINPTYLHNASIIYHYKNIQDGIGVNTMPYHSIKYLSKSYQPMDKGCGKHIDNLNKTDIKEGKGKNKDAQPADDPNQKIRILSDKLRNELPFALTKCNPWHDFSIYTDGVELYYTGKNFNSPRSVNGLPWYRRVLSTFRLGYMLYLYDPAFELLSLLTDEEQRVINIRWRISGYNPLCLISIYIFKMPVNKKYFDFMSTFYVTKQGKVWRHDIKKIREISDSVPLRTKIKALKNGGLATETSMATKTTL